MLKSLVFNFDKRKLEKERSVKVDEGGNGDEEKKKN